MNSVLIVEDEKLIRQGIKSMIQRSGVPVNTIVECNNGVIALEMLKTQKIDVMFTDIRMPKMDGIELVEKLQKLDEEHRPMTVVISGYDDFSYAVHMLRSGVKEYILKPVDREQIAHVLRRLNQEIEQRQTKQKEIRNIGYQQLKYLLLNKNITAEETETIKKQFEELLLSGEYVVCCLEKQEQAPENDKIIFLNDVEGNSVYIADASNKEYLLRNELREKYAGVSLLHGSLEEIPAAYTESKAAREEAYFTGSHAAEYQEPVRISQETVEPETVQRIAQMVGTERMEEALLILEKMAENAKKNRLSRASFTDGMKSLIETITATYQNVVAVEKEGLKVLRNPYVFSNLEEYMEALTGWIIAFHEKVDAHFDDYKNKQKMKQAISYIQENFYKDLNMAVVSNHVSMNYSLFSYIFKQYTGSNFVNYLKNLRIDMAKKLLEDTDLRILEISQRVGYDNEKYFMKTFKNVCGVSPTEYRKNMQLKNE